MPATSRTVTRKNANNMARKLGMSMLQRNSRVQRAVSAIKSAAPSAKAGNAAALVFLKTIKTHNKNRTRNNRR
jgi:acyl-homoserine lactone acylase PvdQ